MTNHPEASPRSSDKQVLITRDFDAPRELVFRAWTEKENLQRWFAPHGCTVEFRKFEFREGGSFLSCIRNPQYPACWCTGVYREILPSQRLVFTMAIADEQGHRLMAEQAGMHRDWPEETVVTVTFTEAAGKTRLTLQQTVSEPLAKETGAYPSWLQMFDRLAGELAKTPSVLAKS